MSQPEDEPEQVTVIVRERAPDRELDVRPSAMERARGAQSPALVDERALVRPREHAPEIADVRFDYVTITLRQGAMDVKGPGTGASGFTDLAHALNVLAGAGYRLINGISSGPVAIYILERASRT